MPRLQLTSLNLARQGAHVNTSWALIFTIQLSNEKNTDCNKKGVTSMLLSSFDVTPSTYKSEHPAGESCTPRLQLYKVKT